MLANALVDMLMAVPGPVIMYWGYWIVFVAAFLESFPVFGLFVPGQTLVIIAGFLIRVTPLEAGPVIAAAAIGAFAGDLLGYGIGRRYGASFVTRYGSRLLRHRQRYERVRELVNGHGGKALILGRFNSFSRAFMPFIGGISRLRLAVFLFYGPIAAVSWAVTFVGIGYILGRGYQAALTYVSIYSALFFLALVILLAGYYVMKRSRKALRTSGVYLALLNLVSLTVLTDVTVRVINRHGILSIDRHIQELIMQQSGGLVTGIMGVVTRLMNPLEFLVISLAVLLGLWLLRRKTEMIIYLVCVLGGTAINTAMKAAILRPRPENELAFFFGYSYPSLHATLAAVFFPVVIYFFAGDIRSLVLRRCFIAAMLLFLIAVSLSRMVLLVHWLSDVVGGVALGFFWFSLVILAYRQYRHRQQSHR